ncbi:MAG: F0F1 ATP synthase subunit epsilon [Pseudomonadota bacterium]
MAKSMQVNIVSAEGEIFAGTADMVIAPAKLGEVGVAPGHAPMITPLNAGEVRVQSEGHEEQHIFVSGGMLEVQPKVLTVLADTAIRAADLDEAAAIEAKQRAEEALADRKESMDYAKAQAELVEAIAQLQMIRRMKK